MQGFFGGHVQIWIVFLFQDAVLDMKEWLHASTVARFINQCLLYVLERNRKERRATGTLLKEMVKRKLFNSSDILHG